MVQGIMNMTPVRFVYTSVLPHSMINHVYVTLYMYPNILRSASACTYVRHIWKFSTSCIFSQLCIPSLGAATFTN